MAQPIPPCNSLLFQYTIRKSNEKAHVFHNLYDEYAWKEGEYRLDIQKYEAFLKTIELGSITKAAEALCYSQSGISRMIQEVEKELSLSLLERGRGGVRLTAEGTKLLPQMKTLCNAYQSLLQQAGDVKELTAGLIRIGTFSSVATHWLPSIIREFHAYKRPLFFYLHWH